jgi:hypothetical protein
VLIALSIVLAHSHAGFTSYRGLPLRVARGLGEAIALGVPLPLPCKTPGEQPSSQGNGGGTAQNSELAVLSLACEQYMAVPTQLENFRAHNSWYDATVRRSQSSPRQAHGR